MIRQDAAHKLFIRTQTKIGLFVPGPLSEAVASRCTCFVPPINVETHALYDYVLCGRGSPRWPRASWVVFTLLPTQHLDLDTAIPHFS